jgi:hypothetical protein
LSLACVEILVHLDKSELPRDYVWSRAELAKDPGFLEVTDLSHVVILPGRWRLVGGRGRPACYSRAIGRDPRGIQCPSQSKPPRIQRGRLESAAAVPV